MDQKGNLLILLAFMIVFVLGLIFLVNPTNLNKFKNDYSQRLSNPPIDSAVPSNSDSKDFRFDNLKFELKLFSTDTAKEGNAYIEIHRDGKIIDIVRNGTNHNSLNSYLNDSDTKKTIKILNQESMKINDYEAIVRVETDQAKNQKAYYIYTDNWVYIISTNEESLFDDLDQIAKSFRYTP